MRARTSSQQAAQRAQIVLRAAEDTRNIDIAEELGIVCDTVQPWRDRFAAARLADLEDRPHRPPPVSFARALRAARAARPPDPARSDSYRPTILSLHRLTEAVSYGVRLVLADRFC